MWQELGQLRQYNARREDELVSQHGAEKKNLPRTRKAEYRVRYQMFRESLHISNPSMTAEEEKNKIKEVT